jgi:hypothetical protein
VRLESWCGHAVPERDNFKEELWQNDHGSKKKKKSNPSLFSVFLLAKHGRCPTFAL